MCQPFRSGNFNVQLGLHPENQTRQSTAKLNSSMLIGDFPWGWLHERDNHPIRRLCNHTELSRDQSCGMTSERWLKGTQWPPPDITPLRTAVFRNRCTKQCVYMAEASPAITYQPTLTRVEYPECSHLLYSCKLAWTSSIPESKPSHKTKFTINEPTIWPQL